MALWNGDSTWDARLASKWRSGLPLGGALRFESPCNVNRFLARAERSRLRLAEESARRKRQREEIRKAGGVGLGN